MGAVGPGKERGLEKQEVRRLLSLVAEGALPVEGALAQLEGAGFADLGYARVDTRRQLRTGVTEVVYGEGKTAEQVVGICQALADAGQGRVLVTRLDAEKAAAVQEALPHAQYWENCHLLLTASLPEPDGKGVVAVVCAGASDLSVAEEAALTAEALGNRVERVYDAGVAGLHRLFSSADVLADGGGADQRVVRGVAGGRGGAGGHAERLVQRHFGGEYRQRFRGGFPGQPHQSFIGGLHGKDAVSGMRGGGERRHDCGGPARFGSEPGGAGSGAGQPALGGV